MLRLVACAAASLLLWVACAGFGLSIIARGFSGGATVRYVRPLSEARAGVAACIGLGVFVALGGAAIALHVSVVLVAVLFVVIGVGLAWRTFMQGHSGRRVTRRNLVFGLLAGAAIVIVGLEQAAAGFHTYINPCDDLLAYLPMTHRLLQTRALVEPWSLRRLQTFGGQTFLQALPVRLFGDIGLGLLDTVVASVFLAGLVLASGLRSSWRRVVGLAFVLAIPLLAVPRVSASPVLLMVPLVAGGLAAVVELRRGLREGDAATVQRWSIAGGVLIAALIAIRSYSAPAVALALVVGALTASGLATGRARAGAVGIAIVTAVAAVAPWSATLWQSSGTPLFPIIPGNLNARVPSATDPTLHGFGAVVSRAVDLVMVGPYLWVTLGILAASFAFWRLLPDAVAIVIAAIAVLANIALLSVILTVSGGYNFSRYASAVGAGLAVFFLIEVLRADDAVERHMGIARTAAIAMFGTSIVLAACVFFPFDSAIRSRTVPSMREAISAAIHGRPDQQITPSEATRDYEHALASIDPRHTIVAVDRPYLIDYSKYDLPSLDLPGWAAPGGQFPFFSGPLPKLHALQRAGFRQLLLTQPADNACLSTTRITQSLQSRQLDERLYARYYVDFERDLETITRRAPGAVQVFGSLLVLDLARAELVLRTT